MIHKLNRAIIILAITVLLMSSACSLSPRLRAPAGTPFRPPTLQPATPQPSPTSDGAADGGTAATPGAACFNSLTYMEDLSIPDGSAVPPGSSMDKRWSVRNNGTCNWEEGYTLRLIAGEELGSAPEQALVPARSGSETTIRLLLTAPDEEGMYKSAWQAFDPDGNAFGDPVFIDFLVQKPAVE